MAPQAAVSDQTPHAFPAPQDLTLVSTWYGVFLIGPDGVVERRLFPQDPEAIAERLHRVRSGQVLDEENAIVAAAKTKGIEAPVLVLEGRLRALGRLDRDPIAHPTGFDPTASGYKPTLLREASLRLAIREARAHLSERDRLIVQEVRALDEIIRSVNLLSERLREWYAIHAPEVVGQVRQHKDLAHLIAHHENRTEVMAAVQGLSPSELGVDLPAADEAIVRAFAEGLDALYATWDRIESRLLDAMQEVAPALSTVAGAMLGARLISQAGGLQDLALAPAGTVQTLGAENALFRHLKDGSPPPKHGLLYQHEAVNRAPWWQRGKVSRALAGKISIAAKADAFGAPPERGAELLRDFEERLDQIRKRHPHAPRRNTGGKGGFGGAPRGGGHHGRRKGGRSDAPKLPDRAPGPARPIRRRGGDGPNTGAGGRGGGGGDRRPSGGGRGGGGSR